MTEKTILKTLPRLPLMVHVRHPSSRIWLPAASSAVSIDRSCCLSASASAIVE